jgi:D-3-phosphoglycerate dehydrogenase
MKKRVIVTTLPFGAANTTPIELLREAGIEVVLNPLGRRLREDEVASIIAGFPVVIAGTETISSKAMSLCPDLKAICRVGIGLDGVALNAARQSGIAVSYTPDGPSAAVAELTIGLMVDLLRGVTAADRELRNGTWTRSAGHRISRSTIGVIGVGRIGRRVIRHLLGGFPGVRILANDPMPDPTLDAVEWTTKDRIYAEADVITLHVPLTPDTVDMISDRELSCMKRSASLVNTSRGGIINEAALAKALTSASIAGAAIDVFVEEPYSGPLTDIKTIILTCHMGSMTVDCRARMEIEATEEAIRFFSGVPFRSPVPDSEYDLAQR